MDAAVAALVGAAIGAIASVAGVWIQQKHQGDRDLVAAAVNLGLAEFHSDVERASNGKGVTYVPPPYGYVAYNAAVLRAIARHELTPAKLEAINKEHEALSAVIGFPE